MTILKITVEDEQVGLLRKLLRKTSFVKNIEEEHTVPGNPLNDRSSSVNNIKKLLEEARGKHLFKEIEDPSAWQRGLRKEWERDF